MLGVFWRQAGPKARNKQKWVQSCGGWTLFLALITCCRHINQWWVYRSCPMSWCAHTPRGNPLQHQAGVVLLPVENQDKVRSDFSQTADLFWHTLALDSGDFESVNSLRRNRITVFWKTLLKAESQNLTAKLPLFLPDSWFVRDSMSH